MASEKLSEAGTFLQSEIGKTYKYSMRCTKLDYASLSLLEVAQASDLLFLTLHKNASTFRILLFLFYQNLRYHKVIIGRLRMYDSIPNYMYSMY